MFHITPDTINGIYESLGAIFILRHCKALWKSKQAWGVAIDALIFFDSWGAWNLYYYPSLRQWFSFYGGLALFICNLGYLAMLIWIRKRYKQRSKEIESICSCAIPGPFCGPEHCMRKS